MKAKLLTLFVSALVSSTSHASLVNDFYVADLNSSDSPSGYPCLPPNTLTADNFVFTFRPANTSNPIKTGVSTAFVNDFPALNGLGISLARVIMDPNGFFQMHTHRATELLIMVEGEITAGMITSNNKFYLKTLKPGDLIVFPPGLMHFLANYGKVKASGFATFSSSNPGIHLFTEIFSNDLASDILAQTTFLDVAQVKKLKALFGGSG